MILRLISSGKLEHILKGAGVFLRDYSTGQGICNTFWKECGYGEPEMSRDRWIELLHPEDRVRVVEAVTRLQEGTGDFFSEEYRFRDARGRYRWVRSRAIVLERDAKKVPTLYLGIDTEITDLMARLETERNEREEMERRYLDAEALRQASTVVTAGVNPSESIGRILAQSAGIVSADAVFIWAVTEDGLECMGARGAECLPPIPQDGLPRTFAWVLQEKRPRRVFGRPVSRGREIYRDSLYMPVVSRGRILGILEFLGKGPRALGHRAEGPASVFADSVAVALENALEFRELDREAGLDWLTNLPTRRRFDFRARAYLEGPADESCFCVVMIDLDKFKLVNDTFGHKAGDQGLAAAAKVCREALRSTDLVCRYGGEEIALLLPGADAKAGLAVAERIRSGVEALRFPEFPEMRLTVSLGIRVSCGGSRDLSVLLVDADKALYKAKAEGRNRVVLSDPEVSSALGLGTIDPTRCTR